MTRNTFSLAALGLLTAVPMLASASPISLRRDSVIPVVFEDTLTVRGTREGDRFTARVDDTRYLPAGTKFEGRVVGVRETRRDEPAMMDLAFDTLVMPDGHRQRIDSVPIPLTDRYVSRDREGRFVVKNNVKKKESTVLGGMIGGFILGSIFQKQLEGVVLGAIAGVLIATNDRSNDGSTVVTKGDRMGGLIQRDVQFDWRGNGADSRREDDRWDSRDARRQDDRRQDDRWDERRQDDRRQDDRRQDDRWGNEREERWDDREVKISYGSRELRWGRDGRPYREGSTLMVPLQATATQMGMRVSRDNGRTDRYIFVDGNDGYLQVELGTREARMNGRRISMPESPTERDRTVYVPLEILAQLSKETVYVNGTRVARRNAY